MRQFSRYFKRYDHFAEKAREDIDVADVDQDDQWGTVRNDEHQGSSERSVRRV